jgi:charged multivesicular body protein 4
MSIFQRLFGNSKQQDNNNISSDEAIKRLSSVEEILNKKQEHLENEIEGEKANALRYSKQGNKRGALNALKRKKKHENTLRQIDGTLTTLELQRESLQNASSNMEVLRVMRQAAGALKKSNQNLDVDDVHDLMDDLSEQNTIG